MASSNLPMPLSCRLGLVCQSLRAMGLCWHAQQPGPLGGEWSGVVCQGGAATSVVGNGSRGGAAKVVGQGGEWQGVVQPG